MTSGVPRIILNVDDYTVRSCISWSWVSSCQDWTLAVNLLLSWDDQKTISAADMEEFLSKFLEAGPVYGLLGFSGRALGAWALGFLAI